MTITIRKASVADAATLAAFGARVFRETFAKDNTAEDMELFLGEYYGVERQTREIASPSNTTLLVYDDETLVAFAQLFEGTTTACLRGESPIQLARFYVDHAQHGRGVARMLMDAVLALAREKNARTLWLGVWERNPRAIRFYEKCGFVDIGSEPFLVGRDLQTDRVMALSL